MNNRLKLIEQQLIGIDSAGFQNLCDVYLGLRENEISSMQRTGSQLGKQKTVKGTPDTFFRLSDGSLRYVEYTTTEKGLVDKIKKDIDACTDESLTGVPPDEVYKIIICFNSKLDVQQETEITKYADSKQIRIELIGLSWLALEIFSKYLIIAKDILGIPLDTGQLLPLEIFIEEYDNKAGKLSTPINNIFLHRKDELADIELHFQNNNIIILSGFPGVGKTKFALEAINIFLSKNPDYTPFAVSKKDVDISEDLRIHLQSDKNYILLVDDANRQLVNFKQILGVFKEKRKGEIKLLLTVRNYALNDVMNECFEFEPHHISINKFTDKEIIELLESDSFKILNSKYQRRIVALCDGNARLAVMAARLAKQKQSIFLFDDVSDLYDAYFQTFIKDFDIFGNQSMLKTLGIISFFYSINRGDKRFIDALLNAFEINYYDFNEAIEELHKKELLEVQYNHAKVSEQVMGTYFFYKVFIKEEVLSFKTLFFNYFSEWNKRFSDTIIPSNNSFGYENVLSKVSNTLDEYFANIIADEQKVEDFISLFWFYKRDEMLAYYHQKISALPEPVDQYYRPVYGMNEFSWNHDKTLSLLANLFNHYTESFIPALQLCFEYSRKIPGAFPELIKTIRELIVFDEQDEESGFARQAELIKLLIQNINKKTPHYSIAFFAIAKTMLEHHFQISKGGRNHTFSIYHYPLPFSDEIKTLRKTIWTALFEKFEEYPQEVLNVYKDFKPVLKKPILQILEYDLSFILQFINSKLDSSKFTHIHYVHELVSFLNRMNMPDRSYQSLTSTFTSLEYECFRKLDWNRIRNKESYDFKNHEDFHKLKLKELQSAFLFKSESEFQAVHDGVKNILSIEKNNDYAVNNSLNIIAELNFIQNDELGFQFLISILNNYPPGLNPLHKTIAALVQKSENWALKLWGHLKTWSHECKIYWQLAFFDHLPESFCNTFYKNELLATINSIEKSISYIQFESIEKFIPFDESIIATSLKSIVNKIETESILITLSFDFFEKYSKFILHDLMTLRTAYMQQEKGSQHFDYQRKGFQTIMETDEDFLYYYLNENCSEFKTNRRNDDFHLPFLWNFENYKPIIRKAANLIIDLNPFMSYGDYSLSILFGDLEAFQHMKAKDFILEYIVEYNADSTKMNAIFNTIRQHFHEFFETSFLKYLNLNPDANAFKNISWGGNGGAYSGDVIIGEVRAKAWQNLHHITEKVDNQLAMIPIRGYLKLQIGHEIKYGEEERKRKFIYPDW